MAVSADFSTSFRFAWLSAAWNHGVKADLDCCLQILGMEDMHLQRIQSQLTSALGDDSGRKLRVLQQAIEQLAREKSLDRDHSTSVQDGVKNIKPEDLERLVLMFDCLLLFSVDIF